MSYHSIAYHTSIHLSIYLSIYISIYLSTYLSTYISIHPSIYLSICLSSNVRCCCCQPTDINGGNGGAYQYLFTNDNKVRLALSLYCCAVCIVRVLFCVLCVYVVCACVCCVCVVFVCVCCVVFVLFSLFLFVLFFSLRCAFPFPRIFLYYRIVVVCVMTGYLASLSALSLFPVSPCLFSLYLPLLSLFPVPLLTLSSLSLSLPCLSLSLPMYNTHKISSLKYMYMYTYCIRACILCACVHACVRACVRNVCVCACLHTYMILCACVCACVRVCACVCVCVCVCACIAQTERDPADHWRLSGRWRLRAFVESEPTGRSSAQSPQSPTQRPQSDQLITTAASQRLPLSQRRDATGPQARARQGRVR